ncbi:hypothetical protein [Rhodococcus koreensis]|uniref:hypothetical protein n=1 Tax=Rhodococcus koreensis TaxID=99653 RepID=UPI00197F10CA|nr:hypothetical protein [Rhodococcus koreensis]QSE87070.1 hypothetical protein JWS14_49220 [Rhodococcus koreensis]
MGIDQKVTVDEYGAERGGRDLPFRPPAVSVGGTSGGGGGCKPFCEIEFLSISRDRTQQCDPRSRTLVVGMTVIISQTRAWPPKIGSFND